jgi:hypothetical protein
MALWTGPLSFNVGPVPGLALCLGTGTGIIYTVSKLLISELSQEFNERIMKIF